MGYGYIEMASEADVEKALEKNHQQFLGRKLSVVKSNPKHQKATPGAPPNRQFQPNKPQNNTNKPGSQSETPSSRLVHSFIFLPVYLPPTSSFSHLFLLKETKTACPTEGADATTKYRADQN